jgi:hypothetical protein
MDDNVGIGVEALRRNTTGSSNIAIGTTSLVFNTTGVSNIAIGCDAGRANTTGSGNVFIGTCAGRNGGNVGRSVAVGEFSQRSAVAGQCNTSVGWSSLENAAGSFNTALGTCAGSLITTGCNNVAIGFGSQVAFGNQNNQLAIGFDTGCYWLQGDSNKNIRPGASIIDCTGSVGTCGQIMCSTGTALRWSDVGKTASGVVSTVNVANQCVTIDDLQFGLWNGCKSFVARLTPGCAAITASWSTCHTPDGGGALATTTVQDFAFAVGGSWRYLWFDLNFGAHGKTQSATICVRPTSGATRMYQFMGMIGASYCCNPISVTRIL